MILREEKNDLFNYYGRYWLAHCISGDLVMGKGIAVEFAKRGVKRYLIDRYGYNMLFPGDCALDKDHKVFNLITKKAYYHKPTYKDLSLSLHVMKICAKRMNLHRICMPVIGCGLDRLDWSKVKNIIYREFEDTDIEIIVCKL